MKEEKKWMNATPFGFTLVELIVVLVILSILSAVAVPTVLGFIDEGKAKECRTQVEALTAEISSAKLAYEANGEIGEDGKIGREFDAAQIEAYIVSAGAEGRCPVDDVAYVYKQDEHKIVCPKGHGEGVISDAGKFTVAVVENTDKRESPDESKPEPEPEPSTGDQENEKKEHTYHAAIDPNSLNMKTGDAGNSVHVTVTDGGETVPEDHIVAVEWIYPSDRCVTGNESGMTAFVNPAHEGSGKLSCKVTVRDDDGNTTTFTADPIDVAVTATAPELNMSGPDELHVKKGETKGLGVTATDENGNPYPGEVTYSSSDPSAVTVDESGNVTGVTPGASCVVTVTVTDDDGNVVGTKDVTVTVDSPELRWSGPDELHVKKGETKGLGVTATDENGNPYPGKVTYSSSDPSAVTVDEDGNVTGVTPGASCVVTVTVTDDDGNVVGTKDVTVTVDSPELSLSGPDELSVKKDETKNLGVTATDENGDPYPGTVTYKSSDPSVATVDENGNVTGVKPGASCDVTVTVTDENGKVVGTKNVNVTVSENEKEEKEEGVILKASDQIWAEDPGRGDVTAININLEDFMGWMLTKPNSNKDGRWSCETSGVDMIQGENDTFEIHAVIRNWEAGKEYIFVYTPLNGVGTVQKIRVTVGYSLKSIDQVSLNPSKNNLAINEGIDVSTTYQDKKTTDKIQWEIVPPEGEEFPDGNAPAKLDVHDSEHARLTALSTGRFRVRVFCHRERWMGTDQEVVEKFSDVITVGDGSDGNQQQETQNQSENQSENQGKVTGITLNPASMTLKVGQSKQLEVVLATDGDIDMGKLECSFYVWGSSCASVNPSGQSKNIATLTGTQKGGTTIGVQVQYNGNWVGQETCQVTVEEMPTDQAAIGEDCFDAISWEQFKKNVEDGVASEHKYGVNRNHGDSTEIVLFYDEVDGENGVKKRVLYMARGNTAYFETVGSSTKFSEYMKTDAGERFFVVDLENIKDINEEDLENAETKKGGWPNGTVVRVKKMTGEYEYYVSYNEGDKKTQLKDILKDQTDSECGWWKLSVLS